jgi:1,4-alpha-glucan branching enzyme
MSATADELLQVAKPAIRTTQPQTTERQEPEDIDTKLSEYYGVNQINEAVVFVTLYPRAESVHVAGDFNNWQPEQTPMQKVDAGGVWKTKLSLPAGKYHYRLVVDGQWQQDPYNELTELNPFGEFNSVIEVQ